MTSQSHSRLREIAWSGVLLLLFVGLVLSHVSLPLGGDQGLYLYGAKELSNGAVLYKDFWDLKSPGVYFFYLLAGSAFGFSVPGLHIVEAVWLGLAAWFALRIARGATSNSSVARLAPLLSIGALFVAATPWHLTQPDGLVILPIVVGAWSLSAGAFTDEVPRWRFFLAGVAAGVAAIFVTAMILVVLGMLAVCFAFEWYRQGGMSSRTLLRSTVYVVAGLSVPIGILLAVFQWQGGSQEIAWTMLSYPFAARAVFDYELPMLAHSVRWFYGAVGSLLPAIVVGVLITSQRLLRKDRAALPGLLMIAWLAFGAIAILLQYHYSWEFHFNHLFVPVGVLAVIGVDEVVRQFRLNVARTVCGAVLLVMLAFPALVIKKLALLDSFSDQTSAYQSSVRAGMGSAGPQDSLYVFGDPRILLASGRRQPVVHNGWALEVMIDKQWQSFSQALRVANPTYLYLHSSYRSLVREKAPELSEWITTEYRPMCTDKFGGTWLRRTSDAQETVAEGRHDC
jgi:hypothetical protein